eukprot:CAMPEP_0172300530 /NCGR_PEP_ID=MMETSP1058-20130122/2595_1 /TAXON_ID=83371 /ORGANISM="Detonula confervacea, Strain CCMP 353" /LENGTH=532 /DNA_ID=CAMNT_0013010331 /DNA_START=270 /DNA_END=1868 /DNA_ORIENTATION=+
MDRKPLGENDDHNIYLGDSSHPPSPPLEMMPEGYYPRKPEHMSPSDSSANWGQPYMHAQQQLSPYYVQSALYPNQIHYAYHPNANWYPAAVPSMMPSMGPYYGHQPSRPGLPPPNMAPYQSLDSRGSLSSYSSSDTFGSSSNRRHGGRKQRRGSRHGGGSSPNRGWYRFDENSTLYQMKGRIVEIAKDRDGSKFIQRRLRVADVSEMQIPFDEALNNIEELWDDVYGNYILQGMLEFGTDDMRDKIGKRIIDGDLVSLATKVYGCRLIQKALDTLDREAVANIVASVKGKVWLLVHHHNGNHVIQKSVTKINEFVQADRDQEDNATTSLLLSSLDIIIDEVASNIKDLSIHPYGCRVVQRLIEHCSGPQMTNVLDGISLEGLYSTLINHEYGNYVIQRVLAYGRPSDKEAVFETIITNNNILKLSKQKHSSNVVEMMLTYGNAEQHQRFIEEMLNCFCVDQNYASKSAVVSMAEDNYANYVLKTALDVLEEGPQREKMFSMLLSSLEDLEKSPFAKQIVLRVKAYAQDTNCE